MNRPSSMMFLLAFVVSITVHLNVPRSLYAAEILFRDDFNSTHDSAWIIPSDYRGYDATVVDGWWVWSPRSTVMMAGIDGLPDDVSLRARFQILGEPGGEVFARITGRETLDPSVGSYYGGVTQERAVSGIGFREFLRQSPSTLDFVNKAIDLRLDIEGNQFTFWAWDAEASMPDPLWTVTNSEIKSEDFMTIGYNVLATQSPPDIAWDFVEIRTVPEPEIPGYVFLLMACLILVRTQSVGLRRR